MAGRITGKTAEWALTLLRVVTGFLFMPHGAQKLFGWLGGMGRGGTGATAAFPGLLWVAGVLEFFGGSGDPAGGLHAPDRLRAVGLHGRGVLHGPCPERILAAPESGGAGNALLLHLPAVVSRRRGAVHRGAPVEDTVAIGSLPTLTRHRRAVPLTQGRSTSEFGIGTKRQ